MSATQEFVALEWIRGELSNTLHGAQVALEAVADAPDDSSSMRSCLTAIHQVHGTLKMVQLEGPTQVAAEMEHLAQSLMNNSVPDLRIGQETLMQAILQLPAYLDRLHREQKDTERNYLPMINNLRVARGEERLPGSEIVDDDSGPDLSPLTIEPADQVVNTFFQGNGEENIPKIRARYQSTLAAILKKKDVRENLSTLGKLFTMLDRLCGDSPVGNLAELGLALIEGIATGGIKLDNQSAGLLRGIDAEIRKLAEAGQAGLSNPVDLELGSKLVEVIKASTKDTKKIVATRERYVSVAPEQENVAIGPDDDTMSAVASILIEELTAVTDKLDLYVRSEKRNLSDLTALRPNLEQISSTMVILGNKAQQSTVASQIEVIKGLEGGNDADEEVLLTMAQALLQVQAALGALVTDGEDGSDRDDFANLDEAQAAVVRETRVGLAAAKDTVIDFISSDFDHSKITDLPATLGALRGGLMIVNQKRAGAVLVSAGSYVSQALLTGNQRPELEQMDNLADAITSVDYFLERLLENAGDPYIQMLEVAEAAVEKLGHPVGGAPVVAPAAVVVEEPAAEIVEAPAAEVVEAPAAKVVEAPAAEFVEVPAAEVVEEPAAEVVEAPAAEIVEEPVADDEPAVESSEEPEIVAEDHLDEDDLTLDDFDVEEETTREEELVAVDETTEAEESPEVVVTEVVEEDEEDEPAPDEVTADLPVEAGVIDDEILEIFVEEAGEVLETINEFLPKWQRNPADGEALTEIRRAFHTLKGSGRMVGATVVGELAWSIENLLNALIEGTVQAGPEVLGIVNDVVARIPEGVEAFKDGDQHRFKPESLSEAADALAAGKSVPAVVSEKTPEELEEHTDLEELELESLEVEEVPEAPAAVEETAPIEESELEEIEFEEIELEEDVAEAPAVVEAPAADQEPAALEEPELEEIELEEIEFEALDVETPDSTVDEFVEEDILEEEILEQDIVQEETAESQELADLELEALELDSDDDDDESLILESVEEEASLEDLDDALEALELETVEPPEKPLTTAEALLESDDLELEEIFALEAAEKLEVVDSFVANRPDSSGDLVAAFHTLKGSAAMAEIVSISNIAAPMEQLANEYLLQNKPTDDYLVSACEEAALLIRTVLSDIDASRNAVAGDQSLLARLAGGASAGAEKPAFNFENIILLSEANIAADGWQDVEALTAELQHADEQAVELNQASLSALIHSMLRIYRDAPSRPDDLVLSLMKRAHDHLVYMFDSLASSQPVRPADRVIAELDKITFEDAAAAPDEETEVPGPVTEESAPEPAASAGQPAPAVTELPDDNIDEDVLPIFLEETEELLEEIDASILGWTETGEAGDHLDNLLRQLHTLKGGARMSGLASLGEYAHNFETMLIAVQSRPVPFDDEFFALLNFQQDEIIRRVEIYQKFAAGGASDEELDSLKTAPVPGGATEPLAIAESVDKEPAAQEEDEEAPSPAPAAAVVTDAVVDLPEDKVDEDVLPIFLEESDDLVEELESSIQSWSESPGDLDTLDVLLRNLHTLKGGARMAGLNSLGEYAHNFETFLIGIQQNPVELDDEFFTLLAKRQDEVIRRVEIYKKLSVGAATDEDLASLRQAIEPTLETEPAQDAPASATGTGKIPQAAADTKAVTPAGDKKEASANQEMVRVSADLLEELNSLAGESSITRGRVEQQITDFGDALQEMEETINRIRDQVRRLEIEAESRETLIRTQVGEDSSFDDLEMDRYSMLQTTSRALSEATSDMMDLKDTLVNRARDAETLLHQQARVGGELQEGLTRTRMVPFARLIPRLRRIVRQVSGEVGKSVRFDAYNVEGELDRNVLERIVAPLEHMLRNAVDHGIEDKEKRAAAGKSDQGRISLRLSREGGYVVLTISDDGGGINVDAVRAKAVDRGLITQNQEISNHEVMQFIMHAGFSTAQKLTQISGRGVGMDVVSSEIKALGGSVTIDSTLGVGTEFQIRIPFTVSINRALMVIVKEETYAVPLNTIEGIVRVSPYELEAYYQPDAPMFEYAGQPYRLAYTGKMLDMSGEDPNLSGQVAPLPVILARSGDHSVALQVDRVIGSREVVVKTLGTQFSDVGGISGATILGDGSVVIILDCMALVRSYETQRAAISHDVEVEASEPADNVRKVMIVDDSVTVRKVTSRLMERQGYEVTTAKDGVDALNQLQDIRPDVVLLDIEMPRMDGFEVLRSVRRDENLKDLPIIMITSRTGEKHRQQAIELGVNEYLGKPFQEAILLATIEEVISNARKSAAAKD